MKWFSLTVLLACSPEPDTSAEPAPPSECGDRTIGVEPGECALDFELTDTEQHSITLYDDLMGRPVLVHTSVMWCVICGQVAEDVGALAKTYEEQNLFVVTLLTENEFGDRPTNREVLDWSADMEIDHNTMADHHGFNDSHGSALHPAAVLIGADLEILWRAAGGAVVHGLESELDAALN